ncbi:MAG: TetR family transcriptional regulator [Saprospiraceae bacterium]|nr:TetR family transcriptional regulator [Saprospiraceae bacterium]
MGTKEKILQKSLDLFNANGTDAVTVRHIAAELGMSHGNLCYHFPSTDALIQALYLQLVDKLDAAILRGQTGQQTEMNLSFLYNMTLTTYDLLNQYRFLMLDFVHIMRRIAFIRSHYQQLTAARREQFLFLMYQLQQNGIIRSNLSEQECNDWIALATLFGDFWLSNAAILYAGEEVDKVMYYAQLFMRLGLPYLTEHGLNEWKRIVNS